MEIITSRRNALCVHIRKLGSKRGYRDETGEFLCDGLKLLEEAVNSGAEIVSVLAASDIPFPLPLDARVYSVQRGLLDSISPLTNAQDVVFVCKKPSVARRIDAGGTYVLLDGVQDPGNVGAIMRTANAFGINAVILTGACADPYNPKSLRASMGAVFRQSFFTADAEQLTVYREEGARFVAAAPGAGGRNVTEVDLSGAVISIGSEGAGLSAEVLSLCGETITIPIATGCESLNAAVAAAVIMWESYKCRH